MVVKTAASDLQIRAFVVLREHCTVCKNNRGIPVPRLNIGAAPDRFNPPLSLVAKFLEPRFVHSGPRLNHHLLICYARKSTAPPSGHTKYESERRREGVGSLSEQAYGSHDGCSPMKSA